MLDGKIEKKIEKKKKELKKKIEKKKKRDNTRGGRGEGRRGSIRRVRYLQIDAQKRSSSTSTRAIE